MIIDVCLLVKPSRPTFEEILISGATAVLNGMGRRSLFGWVSCS